MSNNKNIISFRIFSGELKVVGFHLGCFLFTLDIDVKVIMGLGVKEWGKKWVMVSGI